MEQKVAEPKLAMSIPEAAKRLGISESKMRVLVRMDGFPTLIIGKRILVPVKALEKWVEDNTGKKEF